MNGHTRQERHDRLQFQVVLQIVPTGPCAQADLEDALEVAVAALVNDASEVALGPVGSADLASCVIEIEFTMNVLSPTVLHSKMGEVLYVLDRAGFEYAGSRDERIDAPRPRELQPA